MGGGAGGGRRGVGESRGAPEIQTHRNNQIKNVSEAYLSVWWDSGIVETKMGSTSLGMEVATSRW